MKLKEKFLSTLKSASSKEDNHPSFLELELKLQVLRIRQKLVFWKLVFCVRNIVRNCHILDRKKKAFLTRRNFSFHNTLIEMNLDTCLSVKARQFQANANDGIPKGRFWMISACCISFRLHLNFARVEFTYR